MSLDPIDYDVVELRKLARQQGDRYLADEFLWVDLPTDAIEGDLADLDRPSEWYGSLDEREKPYLRQLPEEPAARALAERWVERLVEEVGVETAGKAFAYYESLGWLTESAEADLTNLLLGAGNNPEADGEVDHVDSLSRIVALAQLEDS